MGSSGMVARVGVGMGIGVGIGVGWNVRSSTKQQISRRCEQSTPTVESVPGPVCLIRKFQQACKTEVKELYTTIYIYISYLLIRLIYDVSHPTNATRRNHYSTIFHFFHLNH